MSVAGKHVAKISPGEWVHIELEARLGKGSPRTFKLTVAPRSGPAQVLDDLPIPGSHFHELQWLGFSSTAAEDSTFFLDNIQLKRVGVAP